MTSAGCYGLLAAENIVKSNALKNWKEFTASAGTKLGTRPESIHLELGAHSVDVRVSYIPSKNAYRWLYQIDGNRAKRNAVDRILIDLLCFASSGKQYTVECNGVYMTASTNFYDVTHRLIAQLGKLNG